MEKVVIHDCPICGKPAKAVDKTSEIPFEVERCELENEYRSCYVGLGDKKEYRFTKKKTNPVRYRFQESKGSKNNT